MTYTPEMSDKASNALEDHLENPRDLSMIPAAEKVVGLVTLVLALESALSLAQGRLRGEPEPFPGACNQVLDQSLGAVELLRRSGILPAKDD